MKKNEVKGQKNVVESWKLSKNIPIYQHLCYNEVNDSSDTWQIETNGGIDMPYKAIDIAKYVIDRCTRVGKPISNLHLQKILYYLQGEYLSNNNEGLFDENICAWKYGPVVPEVYDVFCGYGGSKIPNEYEGLSICSQISEFMNPIIDKKMDIDPWVLVDETHEPTKSWFKVFDEGKGNYKVIDKKLITSDFEL